ncbi:hypothetical protein D3C81_1514140 [compost metagenome]
MRGIGLALAAPGGGPLALLALLERGHHAFHIQQGISQTQQLVRRRIVAALAPGPDHRHQALQGVACRTQADHVERLGQLADLGMQGLLALELRRAPLDQVEDIFDADQLVADRQRQ